MGNFFETDLKTADKEIYTSIEKELKRQQDSIELIASENIVSRAVLEAQGSNLTNKYAEGYPGKRYYGGCEFVDEVETVAIERAKKLFKCGYANVQPHSGSQANQAAFFALLEPGDTYLAMSLDQGGHLTHGSPVNFSGRWFKPIPYFLDRETQTIDYDAIEKLALEHKPKLILAGASAYPRKIDFKRFRDIADKVGAYFMADVAHYAGLIVAGLYPNPFPHAHVVTTTTHKTLRGPRSGMILSDDEEMAKKIDKAVFPGYQGGPLMHVIAAKAVAFGEALQPEFKKYAQAVMDNIKALADEVTKRGYKLVSGGTDSHLIIVDLQDKKLTGKAAQESLDRAGLTVSRSQVPFDPQKPYITSGVRIGSPAGTTRGFGVKEFNTIGGLVCEVLDGLVANGLENNRKVEEAVRQKVVDLCAKFPIYSRV